MNKSTIWMSGSNGFVGKHLLDYLKKSKFLISTVSNTNIESDIFCDYSSKNEIKKAIDNNGCPDFFIHLGWGDVYEPHHKSHVTTSLINSQNLIDVLYESGVKKILSIGSSSEYFDTLGALNENVKISKFQNNYVQGKIQLSNYGFKQAHFKNKVFLHIRLFYAYGSGQRDNSLINQLFKSYLTNSKLNLTSCNHFRDYIHINDVIEGIIQILAVDRSEIINLGSGSVIMLKDFIKIFWKELNANPDFLLFGKKSISDLEQVQPKSYADLSKLVFLTGWKPNVSIQEGIKETIINLKSMV
jgi:nucleoside-diphosphate-sugar epimerase